MATKKKASKKASKGRSQTSPPAAKNASALLNELKALPKYEVVDVVLALLDWLRLDAAGNPMEEPGTYDAAAISVMALGGMHGAEHEAPAKRLAAVGRGVMLQSQAMDTTTAMVEVSGYLEGWPAAWHGIPEDERLQRLALTLSKAFGRPIEGEALAKAMRRRTHNGRVADVLLALKLVAMHREPLIDQVNKALKKRR